MLVIAWPTKQTSEQFVGCHWSESTHEMAYVTYFINSNYIGLIFAKAGYD